MESVCPDASHRLLRCLSSEFWLALSRFAPHEEKGWVEAEWRASENNRRPSTTA